MTRIGVVRSAVSTLLAIGCAGSGTEPLRSESIDIQPTIFATGEDAGQQDGEFDRFREPPNVGMVVNNGFVSYRTAMEYALAALPSDATVTSPLLGCRS